MWNEMGTDPLGSQMCYNLECETWASGDLRAVSRFVSAERPDAIVSGNDVAAARLREKLAAIRKGGSIRLAGFDDVAVASQLNLTNHNDFCQSAF